MVSFKSELLNFKIDKQACKGVPLRAEFFVSLCFPRVTSPVATVTTVLYMVPSTFKSIEKLQIPSLVGLFACFFFSFCSDREIRYKVTNTPVPSCTETPAIAKLPATAVAPWPVREKPTRPVLAPYLPS